MQLTRSAPFLILVCALLLTACPGDLPGSKYDGGGGKKDITQVLDGPGTPADKGPPTEQGKPPPDTGKPVDTGKPTDKPKPPDKTPPPDKALPPDKGGGGKTGDPCPPACASGYLCYNSKCRKTCKDGTDVCKAITVCTTSEVCMPISSTLGVCLKATAPGGNCKSTHCGSKHVCASVSGKAYTCLPVCKTKGGACGSGGKCVQAQGGKCLFCTKN